MIRTVARHVLHVGLALALGLVILVRGLQILSDHLYTSDHPVHRAGPRVETPPPTPWPEPTPPAGPARLGPRPSPEPTPTAVPTPALEFKTIPQLARSYSGAAFCIGQGLFVAAAAASNEPVYPVDLPGVLTSGRTLYRDETGFIVFTLSDRPSYMTAEWGLPLVSAAGLKAGDPVTLYAPGMHGSAMATRTRFQALRIDQGRIYMDLETRQAPYLGVPVIDGQDRVVGMAVGGPDRSEVRFVAADAIIKAAQRFGLGSKAP